MKQNLDLIKLETGASEEEVIKKSMKIWNCLSPAYKKVYQELLSCEQE